ncbi:hypothetical protein [Streptomyces purpureus]|uniref:Guanylate cyclase domain-containing protein n=1 Tax=Streptomyces purpureus TaxID=1951 RepID=A0A918H2B4_9ACTN|nr:hypothetical protein [Streptomyces purpureus]GGT34322.1 hypothetical protein GCM10014713_29900 [Streptomyces purpureus]
MPGDVKQYWVVVLDLENSSSRTDPILESLNTAMHDIVGEARKRAGLPEDGIAVEDRGDGVLMILPASVPAIDLVGGFIRALDDELAQRAAVYSAAHAMRFRVAAHLGFASWNGTSWTGGAVNDTCALVEAGPLRGVLTAATSARMVFAVSDQIYQSLVRHGHRSIDPATYLPMPFRTKHGETVRGWVTVPGYPAPPGLTGEEQQPPASGPAPGASGTTGPPPAPAAGSVTNIVTGTVHGDLVQGHKIGTVNLNRPGQP